MQQLVSGTKQDLNEVIIRCLGLVLNKMWLMLLQFPTPTVRQGACRLHLLSKSSHWQSHPYYTLSQRVF